MTVIAKRLLDSIGRREALLLSGIVVAVLIFAGLSPYFATVANAAIILRNSGELLLIGLGLTLLLALAGIDVSVGMVMGLGTIAVGNLLLAGYDPAIAAFAGPAAGIIAGVITGAVVVYGQVPPIIATLGLMGLYRTGIFLALGGGWLSGLPQNLTDLMRSTVAGLPLVAWLIGAAYAFTWFFLRYTPFGPHLLAIGNNEEKARLSGVAVPRSKLIAYTVNGLLCGCAATLYVATYRNVEVTIGGTIALDAIAAVVLGGTSVLGGRASLLGTVLGVLLIRILQNGLLLAGVPSLWQTVVTGALLLIVLAIEGVFAELGLRTFGRQRIV